MGCNGAVECKDVTFLCLSVCIAGGTLGLVVAVNVLRNFCEVQGIVFNCLRFLWHEGMQA